MKESTVVITAQLTIIQKHPNNKVVSLDQKGIADEIKKEFRCDDVKILKTQVFERDIKKHKGGSICWECKKICGKCSWSRNFTPVPGWRAEPVKRRYQGKMEGTYIVQDCPEYERG